MSSSTPSSQAESNSQHQTFHLCNNCLSMMSHSSEAQREKKIGNILLKPTCDVNAECYLCCGLLTCNSDNDSKNSFLDAYIERRTGDRNFFEKDIDSKYVTIDEDSLVPPLLLWREKRFNTVIKDANPDYDLHRQTNKERIRERVENGIMERSARLSEAEGSSSSTTSSKLEILLYPNSGIGGEKDIACLKVSLRYRSESMTTSSSGTSASNSGNMKSETNIVLTAAFNQEDSYGGNNNSSRNRGGKKGKGKGKKGKNNKGKGKSKDSNEQAKNEEIPPVVEGEDESPSTTAPPLQEIASNLENKLLTPQEISNFNQFLNRLNTVDDFEKVYPMKKNSNNTGSNDKTKTTISFSPSSVTRLPLFYKGRYCKFSREVSQSPWTIHDKDGPKEGVRKTAWSVEELILQPIVERVFGIVGNIDGNDGPKLKFHAAGREDADVRMLGCGRPFIIEVNDARKRPLEVEDVKEGSLKEDEVLDGEPDTKRQRTDNKAEEKKDQDGLLSYRVGVDQYPKAILQGETKDSIDTASTWTDNDKKKWWATTLDYQTGNTKFDDEMLKKNMLTVHNLQPTTKAFMARLQDSAESHTKVYRCTYRFFVFFKFQSII